MFGKKPTDEQQDIQQGATSDRPAGGSAAPAPEARAAATRPAAPRPAAPSGQGEGAFIGASIQIHGELRGEEDVFVEGQVHGTVHLSSNTITIGNRGRLKADVYAHTILVDGKVEGDLYGAEQVIVRKSAEVRGNISSPRVSLEDGATFKGAIEMDPEAVKAALGSSSGQRNAPTPLKTGPATVADSRGSGQA
ncbi:MAG: polymer-forming cytoskeletal protein [Chromatiales bacterium]|nr:polymer-forming cytoskeletal protein [Chromatiales bacterium]